MWARTGDNRTPFPFFKPNKYDYELTLESARVSLLCEFGSHEFISFNFTRCHEGSGVIPTDIEYNQSFSYQREDRTLIIGFRERSHLDMLKVLGY